MFEFPTRPLGIGGVLDGGFKLFAAAFKPSLPIIVPYALLSGIANLTLGGSFAAFDPQAPDLSGMGPMIGVVVLLNLFTALVLFPAAVKRIDAVARGEAIGTMAAIRYALGRSGWLFLCWLCYVLVLGVGLLLLVVPGLILGLSLFLAPYAIVILERRGPIDSLLDSHRLIWGNWWRTALILTVILIVLSVLYTIVVVLAAMFALFGTGVEGAGLIVDIVLVPLMMVAIMPFSISAILMIYYDLKLRREGGDLAERIAQVGAT